MYQSKTKMNMNFQYNRKKGTKSKFSIQKIRFSSKYSSTIGLTIAKCKNFLMDLDFQFCHVLQITIIIFSTLTSIDGMKNIGDRNMIE